MYTHNVREALLSWHTYTTHVPCIWHQHDVIVYRMLVHVAVSTLADGWWCSENPDPQDSDNKGNIWLCRRGCDVSCIDTIMIPSLELRISSLSHNFGVSSKVVTTNSRRKGWVPVLCLALFTPAFVTCTKVCTASCERYKDNILLLGGKVLSPLLLCVVWRRRWRQTPRRPCSSWSLTWTKTRGTKRVHCLLPLLDTQVLALHLCHKQLQDPV